MNIISLQFQNINSFSGKKLALDFSTPAFSNAIFAITGPTGSGKSSILDAITLALFAKAARYKDKVNPNEVMSKGQNECFSELCFEANGKRYKAYWSLKRTVKKTTQSETYRPNRHLADEDGTIISTKVNEINDKIEEITGLDYSRFLRSILLAQGQFREFLDASARDRAELLEKITGGELYSTLGARAYEKAKDWEEQIKEKEAILKDSAYDDSQHEQLRLEETKISEKLEGTKKEEKSNTTQLGHITQLIDLHKRRTELLTKREELEGMKDEITALENRLEKHRQASELQGLIKQRETLHAENKRLEEALQSAETLLEAENLRYRQMLITISQYCKKKHVALQAEYNTQRAGIDKLSNDIKALDDWLQEHLGDGSIEKELPNIRRIAEDIRQHSNDRSRTARSLKDEMRKKDEHEAAYNKATEDIQRLKKEKDALFQALKELLDTALAACTRLLGEYKRHQETITEEIKSAERECDSSITVAVLESERSRLVSGEPCPLCGSRDHPHAPATHAPIDRGIQEPYNEAMKAGKEKIQKLRETLRSIDGYKSKVDAMNTRIQEYVHRYTDSAAHISGAVDHSTDLSTGHSTDLSTDLSASIRALPELQDEMETVKTLVAAIVEKGTEYEKAVAKTTESQNKLETAELLLRGCRNDIQALEAENIALSEKITKAKQGFATSLASWDISYNPADDCSNYIEILEGRMQTFQEKDRRKPLLRSEKEHSQLVLKNNEDESNNLLEEIKILERELQEMGEGETHAPELHDLDMGLDMGTELKRSSSKKEGLQLLHRRESARTEKKHQYESNKQQTEGINQELNVRLQELGFSDIDECTKALLPDAGTHHERIKEYHRQVDEITTLLSDLEKTWEKICTNTDERSRALSSLQEEKAALMQKEKDLKEEIQLLSEQRGENRKQQEQALLEKEKMEESKKELARIKKSSLPWIELAKLIGSADGSSFSRFAQGLTINHLINIANNNLKTLTPRYALRRSSQNKELEFSIIDLYQAETERSTQSLSGGESFLLSLALALALSELMSNKNRIECIFIDEGFGSLDQDSLDMALAALENLRLENRMIGIISHVEALKDRIPTQIRVFQKQDGYASLKIISPKNS